MSLDIKLKIERGDFDLSVEHRFAERGVSAIFGPSGSGKTSLLRAIAGLDRLSQGHVSFNGEIWQSQHSFIATHQRRLAYVFQEPSLFEHLNVRGNLEFALKRVPHDERKISLDSVTEMLGLAPLIDRDSVSLSGGEKQRVAIARALCSSPKLLLMDEPLAALDRRSKNEILPYLDELHQSLDIPIVYVSHALAEVARLADELLLLENGRVVGSGPIQTMLTKLDLSLAQGNEAESMVEALVAEHDQEFDLSYLDSAIGRISVPMSSLRSPLKIGEPVRVLIAARDVSITLQQQTDTSILNIFPAKVERVLLGSSAQATVKLLANGVPILAKITRKSAELMNLKVGDNVFVQAKSVALL